MIYYRYHFKEDVSAFIAMFYVATQVSINYFYSIDNVCDSNSLNDYYDNYCMMRIDLPYIEIVLQ